GGGGEEGGGE
ncbi:Hypothetical protein NocV09_05500020, partial [Nannochloropsis oceanica]